MQVQWIHIVMVALGGMAGSVCRFLLSTLVINKFTTRFPWGTFSVNIIGSLLIGLFLGFALKHHANDQWKLLLATGFCGGFTTFSALSNESIMMLKQEQFGILGMYLASTIVVGIGATALGYSLTK
jgi:fluoride exporter